MRLTEEQLQQELQVIEAAKKDPRRFGGLYDRYYKQIFLFVFKRTGEEQVTGDIVSQVFLKALTNLQKYSYRGVPFSAWLYRIASNEVAQHFRNQKGERTVSLEGTQIDQFMGGVDQDDSRDDRTEAYRAVLMESIQEMKPDEIEMIELRFFEQRPFKEVAFILGITENNAKVRMYRIVERLRSRLKKKLGGTLYEA